jgi:hypothetical protein
MYTGLIAELPESGLLDSVRGAVIASRDDETDLMALGVLSQALGRRNVWVLPSGPPAPVDPDDPGSARAARWRAVERRARRPFARGLTHAALAAALRDGGRIRTVDAAAVPPDALALVRLHAGGWTPALEGAPDAGDRLVVIDRVEQRAETLRQEPHG